MSKNFKAWQLVAELSTKHEVVKATIKESELYVTIYTEKTLFHVKHYHYDYGFGCFIEII